MQIAVCVQLVVVESAAVASMGWVVRRLVGLVDWLSDCSGVHGLVLGASPQSIAREGAREPEEMRAEQQEGLHLIHTSSRSLPVRSEGIALDGPCACTSRSVYCLESERKMWKSARAWLVQRVMEERGRRH